VRTLGVYLLKHTVNRNGVTEGSAILRPVRRLAAVLLLLMALAGCNSDDAPPSANFVAGGADRFEQVLERERGQPIVVNKWASWCGPCRLEFPYFRDQAEKRKGEVLFIGVNSNDNRSDAEEFLKEEPVPYKHFEDPKLEIAAVFNAVQAFPSTAFYDSKGELAFVHQGGYKNEADLAEDIDRYAR
jgi:cytochrome c biogenesis protein CcmG, thiol:disulfide interchange protein DsbE